jgi:hypothetical protein
MDSKQFSQQTLAWLEPEILFTSAIRFEKDRDECLKVSELFFGSEILNNGEDGSFATLVKKFLSSFEITNELLQVVFRDNDNSTISNQSWDEILNLNFEGQVTVFSHGECPHHEKIILSIKDRDIVLDLVQSSIQGLLNVVNVLSKQWKATGLLAEKGAKIFHQPTMPSEFYAYIDKVVGEAYIKFIEPPGNEPELSNMHNRYRAVTLAGYITATDPIWEVAAKLSLEMALETMQPIKRS